MSRRINALNCCAAENKKLGVNNAPQTEVPIMLNLDSDVYEGIYRFAALNNIDMSTLCRRIIMGSLGVMEFEGEIAGYSLANACVFDQPSIYKTVIDAVSKDEHTAFDEIAGALLVLSISNLQNVPDEVVKQATDNNIEFNNKLEVE